MARLSREIRRKSRGVTLHSHHAALPLTVPIFYDSSGAGGGIAVGFVDRIDFSRRKPVGRTSDGGPQTNYQLNSDVGDGNVRVATLFPARRKKDLLHICE